MAAVAINYALCFTAFFLSARIALSAGLLFPFCMLACPTVAALAVLKKNRDAALASIVINVVGTPVVFYLLTMGSFD